MEQKKHARNRRLTGGGFTMIEVLVTIVLVTVAFVGVFRGLRALAAIEARTQTADLLQRLSAEKINDLTLLPDPGAGAKTGDFSDRGYPGIGWSAQVEASDAANVDKVTVTATRGSASQALSTLLFVRAPGGAPGAPPP